MHSTYVLVNPASSNFQIHLAKMRHARLPDSVTGDMAIYSITHDPGFRLSADFHAVPIATQTLSGLHASNATREKLAINRMSNINIVASVMLQWLDVQ